VGVLNDALTNASNIIRKGRLGPGQMVCVDLEKGTFQNTQELAREAANAHPYSEWLKSRSFPPFALGRQCISQHEFTLLTQPYTWYAMPGIILCYPEKSR